MLGSPFALILAVSTTARAVGGRAELRPTNVRYVPVPDGRQGQPEDSRAFLGMSELATSIGKVQEHATIRGEPAFLTAARCRAGQTPTARALLGPSSDFEVPLQDPEVPLQDLHA